jgi:hypothetical protein
MAETLDHDVIDAVRRFVDRDVIPVASELEHADEYPHAMVAPKSPRWSPRCASLGFSAQLSRSSMAAWD